MIVYIEIQYTKTRTVHGKYIMNRCLGHNKKIGSRSVQCNFFSFFRKKARRYANIYFIFYEQNLLFSITKQTTTKQS